MRWLLTILRDHPHVFKAGLSSALEYSVDAPSGENHVLLRPWRTTNRQTEFSNVEGRLQYVRTHPVATDYVRRGIASHIEKCTN